MILEIDYKKTKKQNTDAKELNSPNRLLCVRYTSSRGKKYTKTIVLSLELILDLFQIDDSLFLPN